MTRCRHPNELSTHSYCHGGVAPESHPRVQQCHQSIRAERQLRVVLPPTLTGDPPIAFGVLGEQRHHLVRGTRCSGLRPVEAEARSPAEKRNPEHWAIGTIFDGYGEARRNRIVGDIALRPSSKETAEDSLPHRCYVDFIHAYRLPVLKRPRLDTPACCPRAISTGRSRSCHTP